MDINIPEVVAEVEAAFARYNEAVAANDTDVLNEMFWDSEATIRFGLKETQFGKDAIASFRAAREKAPEPRRFENLTITTFGRDLATINTLIRRDSRPTETGRWTHVWARLPQGWSIVTAHASALREDPGA